MCDNDRHPCLVAYSFITSRSILLLPGDGEHIVFLRVRRGLEFLGSVDGEIWRTQRSRTSIPLIGVPG